MAVQKRKTPRKRSTGAAPTKRRRSTRRKRGMGEIFNPKEAKAGFNATLKGAGGGALASVVEKVLPDSMNEQSRALWMLGIAWGGGIMLRQPEIGAGMAGVAAYKLMAEVGLSDSIESYFNGYMPKRRNYAKKIKNMPPYLSQGMPPMGLMQGMPPMGLMNNGYQVGIAPNFGYTDALTRAKMVASRGY